MELLRLHPFTLHFLLLLPLATALTPDSLALLAFRASCGPSGVVLSSWKSASASLHDPCSGRWFGVSCRGGRVVHIILPGLALAGDIQLLTHLPYLRLLNLSRNQLAGPIPPTLRLLYRLRRLDLSHNRLSGPLPQEVGLLLPRLVTLDVSGNFLEGEIPKSLAIFPPEAFAGNRGLCGAPLLASSPCAPSHWSASPRQSRKRLKLLVVIVAGSSLAIVAVLLVSFAVIFWRRRQKRRKRKTSTCAKSQRGSRARTRRGAEITTASVSSSSSVVFFEGCGGFEVEDLMRGSAEVLGRGTIGTTYRVVAEGDPGGKGVVVKRVRRAQGAAVAGNGGSRDMEEKLLNEIGGLRHPNVVGLKAYCFRGEELLLVYDYLPRGSLHSLLHENAGPGRTWLDWATRLKLALGAAEGLAHLHHTCKKSKLHHSRLSSFNIILDDAGNACISDFGLGHLISPPSRRNIFSSASAAHTKTDVYTFGLILLELLTRRMVGEDLGGWVQKVVKEEWTTEVFDLELLGEREAEGEMVALLQVALLCVADNPKDRPEMKVVAAMIGDIQERRSKRIDQTKEASCSSRAVYDISADNDSTSTTTPSISEDTHIDTSS